MKHLIKSTLMLALGFAALVTSTTTWAIPPADFNSGPVIVEGAPGIDCTQFDMNFWVLVDWHYSEYGKVHFDNDGFPVRINGFAIVTNGRFYNSEDGSYEITQVGAAGRGEHRHFVVKFDDAGIMVFYMEAGIGSRVIVPGWGPMSVSVGQVRFESEDGFNWYRTQLTPGLDDMTEDEMYKMCTYLNHE